MKIGNQILTPLYLRPEQKAALDRASKREGRARQAILRDALDAYLKRTTPTKGRATR